MPRITLILTLGCMWLPMVTAGDKANAFKQTATEVKVFDLTNLERMKEKLKPLVLNPALSKIARAHAENMARQMKMEHKLDGKSPSDRAREAKYDFMYIGENLGMGNDDATLAMLMKAWMDSKDHRANIVRAEYSEIGIGIARDKAGILYYAQVFGHPHKD